MGKETSERIQTSVLNAAEKKVLVWLAQRQPAWVTSDFLTYTGVVGALVCAVGFILAHIDKNYLWISSLGLVINWYGDSLDGTLARVRNAQRPVYGFFIDHTLDAVTICIMCIGAGLSPMFRLDVAMLVLVGYLVLSIYTYISTILSGKFLLTYGSLGPTEFRLIVILINTVFMYTSLSEIKWTIEGQTLGIIDVAGLFIACFLFVAWLVQFITDRRVLSKQDPLKPYSPKNNKDTVLKLRIYLQFVVSRLLGTGVDTLILWICSTFIFSSYWEVYVLSPIISFEFAVLSNFLCSYFWIWKSRIGRRSTSDFCIRFLMFNLSSGAGFLMKMFFLLIFQKIFGWDVIYCNLAALLISGLFNYFVADMLVFKSRKRVKVESFDSNDC